MYAIEHAMHYHRAENVKWADSNYKHNVAYTSGTILYSASAPLVLYKYQFPYHVGFFYIHSASSVVVAVAYVLQLFYMHYYTYAG